MITTRAIVFNKPESLALTELSIADPGPDEIVVNVKWSGISTGTERLLWTGKMPPFPGLGYPLVPGYESVGFVAAAGPQSTRRVGETVFVPGARCYGDIKGLFGGSASHVVVKGASAVPIDDGLNEKGTLIALAATAQHAIAMENGKAPDLIVGHGVLGRLLARLTIVAGAPAPTVWETNPTRRTGADGYQVVDPADDDRRDYRSIFDVSGDAALLDTLISRLAVGGEVVLAGFYAEPLSFVFPPAFMKEARIRVAAQWQPADLKAVSEMIADGRLSLDGLITHRSAVIDADAAYRTAFGDAECLKMILEWSGAT